MVRINHDGSKLAVDYNNILSPDSYQNNSTYRECGDFTPHNWQEKNNNLLGVWDIPFETKWFMVTIVIKEVSDRNNILSINFTEPFKPRRGRINCSLNDNGKWRWFGTQFIVKEN